MIIVSDTSPITNLAAVGVLHLLHQLYNRVIIPEGVYDEMVNVGYPVPGAVEVQTLSWIESQPVMDRNKVSQLQIDLDLGEAEAIVLALELNADLLIMDERRGRKIASSLGITGNLRSKASPFRATLQKCSVSRETVGITVVHQLL